MNSDIPDFLSYVMIGDPTFHRRRVLSAISEWLVSEGTDEDVSESIARSFVKRIQSELGLDEGY